MAQNEHTLNAQHANEQEEFGTKRIWQVFFILLFLTGIEFLVALGFVHHWGLVQKGTGLTVFYVILTVVKAYYIIAYFMHLKFEKKTFIICCSVAFTLVIYLIILTLIEGDFLNGALTHQPIYPHP